MTPLVEAYLVRLREYDAAERLSDEEHEAYLTELDRIWYALTDEEVREVEQALAKEVA